MRKTYYYKKYTILPFIFKELWVPKLGLRDDIKVKKEDIENIMVDDNHIKNNEIDYYFIKSYKSYSPSKIKIRKPTWWYVTPELFKEQEVKFYIYKNKQNCIIEWTQEAFSQIETQSNNEKQQHKYLQFDNNEIDLNSILTRFDTRSIKWLWIKVSGNPKVNSIKLKWNQSVHESQEAQDALKSWWVIDHITITYNGFTVTIYKDYRLSFYSNVNLENDIEMIEEIVQKYNLV